MIGKDFTRVLVTMRCKSLFTFVLIWALCFAFDGSLPKCCPENQYLHLHHRNCTSYNVSADTHHTLTFSGVSLKCQLADALLVSEEETSRYSLLPNGSLVLISPTSNNNNNNNNNNTVDTTFEETEFCADLVDDGVYLKFFICACDKIKCVQRCCKVGEMLSRVDTELKCVDDNGSEEWVPPFYPRDKKVSYEISDKAPAFSNCPDTYGHATPTHWRHNWADKFLDEWWSYPNGHALKDNETCGGLVNESHTGTEEVVLYCKDKYQTNDVVSACIHSSASLLLCLTLFTQAILKELRASVHSWAVCCHTVCLLSSNILQLVHAVGYSNMSDPCGVLDFLCLFSIIGANVWLNVMCINMCLGFRIFRKVQSNVKKFIVMSLYAWIFSSLMTSVTAFTYYWEGIPENLKPTLTTTRTCWSRMSHSKDTMRTFAYFYGPMCVLLVANGAMFVFIVMRIKRLQRGTSILKRSESDSSQTGSVSSSIFLYLKIFLVMGIGEMVIEISFWYNDEKVLYVMIMDSVDLLRAISIFVLCVCTPRKLNKLKMMLKRRPDTSQRQCSTETQRTSVSL